MNRPSHLPFLKSLCWDLPDISFLTDDEVLNRYERGWSFINVLTDLTPEEKQYIISLAEAKGSWLQFI